MALQKDIVNAVGTISSYHKIDSIHVRKNEKGNLALDIMIYSYASKAYRDDNVLLANDSTIHSFETSIKFDDIISKAYELLKTLPQYSEAKDI